MTGFIFGAGPVDDYVIATGSTTPRSLPNRFAEVHNVLDYGADPTGVANSATAFQACVNWNSITIATTAPTVAGNETLTFGSNLTAAYRAQILAATAGTVNVTNVTDGATITAGACVENSPTGSTIFLAGVDPVVGTVETGDLVRFDFADRGKIFIPPGNYKLDAAVTFDYFGEMSFVIEGSGKLSKLIGNHANYVLDRNTGGITSGVRVIRNLWVVNNHVSGGGIRLNGCVGSSVENCSINAYRGACFDQNNSAMIYNCKLQGDHGSGGFGVYGTNGFTALNLDIQGYQHAYRTQNIGQQIIGGRIEDCDVGVMVGKNVNGTDQAASAFLIAGISMEEIDVAAIEIRDASGNGLIASNSIGLSSGITPGTRGIHIVSGGPLTFIGNNVGGPYTVAAVDASGANGNGDVKFINNSFNNTTGTRWIQPTDRWKISVEGGDRVFTQACTVAQLNSGAVQGDEANVIDGAASLAWGATVTGGGSTKYKVQYNGAAWTVIGK